MLSTKVQNRTTLVTVLTKLGKERVERGIVAFDDPDHFGMSGCFLARVYGDKYEFIREWFDSDSYEGHISVLARNLGLTEAEALWTIKYFETNKREMQKLVQHWLTYQ